ncbi:hypothetical protein Bbelb_341000 [Branchiostoma belcheri]|nr:hypothetical protein Bbelb_341000 [Branchiostoma belcheri]
MAAEIPPPSPQSVFSIPVLAPDPPGLLSTPSDADKFAARRLSSTPRINKLIESVLRRLYTFNFNRRDPRSVCVCVRRDIGGREVRRLQSDGTGSDQANSTDPSRETCWFRFGCLQRAAGDLVTLKFRLDHASPPGAALVRQLKTTAVGDLTL